MKLSKPATSWPLFLTAKIGTLGGSTATTIPDGKKLIGKSRWQGTREQQQQQQKEKAERKRNALWEDAKVIKGSARAVPRVRVI